MEKVIDTSQIERELTPRIREKLRCEVESDLDGWLAVVDPELRKSATNGRDDLKKTLALIHSAELVDLSIEQYVANLRKNRPGAKIVGHVRYNGSNKVCEVSRLWVRDNGEWYTRAVGMLPGW